MENYSTYYMKHLNEPFNDSDVKFCWWMDDVEKIVLQHTKFHLLDLEDEPYMENFENKIQSEKMAMIVINNFNNYSNFLCD